MVKMEKNSRIELSADGLTAKNAGTNFESVRCNVKVKSGKWYYEIKLITNGLFQIGWCTTAFTPDAAAGNGVGDDSDSWAYDGSRQRKWHAGSAYYGQYWYAGDYIGVAIDLDAKKMDFYRNGHNMGTAYDNFSVGDGLYPAVTLSGGQQCSFNFGKTPFAYPHPSSDYKVLHCFLSEAEVEKLNQLFNKYKAMGVQLSESGETGDIIKGAGFLQYGQDLGVVEDTDPGLMLLAFKLGAEAQWEFSREEFINGWTAFGCSTMEGMKAKLAEWRAEIKNDDSFRAFYYFVFDYLREANKVILLMEEALTVWEMLGFPNKWQYWGKWTDFLKNHTSARSVSKDTWRQFFDFYRAHPTGFDAYDEDSSWPILFDEFVEWMNANKD